MWGEAGPGERGERGKRGEWGERGGHGRLSWKISNALSDVGFFAVVNESKLERKNVIAC